MAPNESAIVAAAVSFADIWQDRWIADGIATQLRCEEFDVLMELLDCCGHQDAVVLWKESHLDGDNEPTDCMYAQYCAANGITPEVDDADAG